MKTRFLEIIIFVEIFQFKRYWFVWIYFKYIIIYALIKLTNKTEKCKIKISFLKHFLYIHESKYYYLEIIVIKKKKCKFHIYFKILIRHYTIFTINISKLDNSIPINTYSCSVPTIVGTVAALYRCIFKLTGGS